MPSVHVPYTTEARPDTGLTNPKLGIWLFLASEVMLFGSLFSAYALLRSGAETWPDQSAVLSVPLATFNTAILIASSVTIRRAWTSIATRQSIDRCQAWTGLTIALGVIFLVVKSVEYADKLTSGLAPATDTFLALYFTMTGLHAAHLAAGIVVNAYLIGPGIRLWRQEPVRFANRIEIAGIYWHFVDVVWILLFVVFYLL